MWEWFKRQEEVSKMTLEVEYRAKCAFCGSWMIESTLENGDRVLYCFDIDCEKRNVLYNRPMAMGFRYTPRPYKSTT